MPVKWGSTTATVSKVVAGDPHIDVTIELNGSETWDPSDSNNIWIYFEGFILKTDRANSPLTIKADGPKNYYKLKSFDIDYQGSTVTFRQVKYYDPEGYSAQAKLKDQFKLTKFYVSNNGPSSDKAIKISDFSITVPLRLNNYKITSVYNNDLVSINPDKGGSNIIAKPNNKNLVQVWEIIPVGLLYIFYNRPSNKGIAYQGVNQSLQLIQIDNYDGGDIGDISIDNKFLWDINLTANEIYTIRNPNQLTQIWDFDLREHLIVQTWEKNDGQNQNWVITPDF